MPPPATPYAYQTLAQVRAALLLRLNSTGTDFWLNAELNLYIAEALQVWNCLTATYVQDFTATFDSTASEWLSLANGTLPTSPRVQTLDSNYLFTFIEYMLLEPPTGGTWTGTPQFTIADLAQALQRRRDQILQATANNVLPFSLPIPVGDSRVYLPDTPSQSILDVRRIRVGGGTSTTTLGTPLTQSHSNRIDESMPVFISNFSGFGPFPASRFGPCTEGDTFNAFATFGITGMAVDFYNSSFVLIQSVSLDDVSDFTAPAGAANFIMGVPNPVVGTEYSCTFNLNGESQAFDWAPDPTGWDVNWSGGDPNLSPFGGITPGSVFTLVPFETNDPTFIYSINFYSASKSLISSTIWNQSPFTFTAPAGAAFWSVIITNPPIPDLTSIGTIFTIAYATTVAGVGSGTTLYREDGLAYEYFENDFTVSTDPPFAWYVLAGPPLAITLDTPVTIPTTLDMLVMVSGGIVSPPTASPLLIPDDWNWVLKCGILADILRKESESVDLERADHFEARFQQGVKLMQELPWLLQARLDNLPVDTPSVAEMDTFAYEWQSDADAQPAIVRGGVDLFAISPAPPTAPSNVAVTLSLVANMPIPATDADFVQVPRDTLDAILDYCEYLAKSKEGGFEFGEAQRTLFKNFIQVAVSTNARLMESGIFESTLRPPNSRQDAADPRFAIAGAKS